MNNLWQILADIVSIEQSDLLIDAPFSIVNIAIKRVYLEGTGKVTSVIIEGSLKRTPAMVEDVAALLDNTSVTTTLAHQLV